MYLNQLLTKQHYIAVISIIVTILNDIDQIGD
jgi:hypothetical protein